MPLWAIFGKLPLAAVEEDQFNTVSALQVMNISVDVLLGYGVERCLNVEWARSCDVVN
jgi:hypothetical protein